MASNRTDLIIFHRNLRIKDNEALYYGSIRQKYRCIYIFDPKYWQGNGKSTRQLYFLKDCLIELDQNLKKLNQDINFVANFGRDVEYYTGIVFEVFSGTKEIASGGRYDDLLQSLGAKKRTPAVGAAINLKIYE